MKALYKTIFGLVLVVILLVVVIGVIIISSFSLFLHTYDVFTRTTPVAELTISEQKTDENGKYADVTLKLLETKDNVFSHILSNGNLNTEQTEATSTYKLYGDTIYLGGPMVKFKDELILINFETMYKLGKIYARYDLDNEKEINRTPAIASSHDINEGYNDWTGLHDAFTSNNLHGTLLSLIIDSMQISAVGQFVDDEPQTYTLYIGNNGFLWRID